MLTGIDTQPPKSVRSGVEPLHMVVTPVWRGGREHLPRVDLGGTFPSFLCSLCPPVRCPTSAPLHLRARPWYRSDHAPPRADGRYGRRRLADGRGGTLDGVLVGDRGGSDRGDCTVAAGALPAPRNREHERGGRALRESHHLPLFRGLRSRGGLRALGPAPPARADTRGRRGNEA